MALATLSIDLEAKIARLQEGMDRAARVNDKTAAVIERRWAAVDGTLRKLGTTLAAAGGVAALARLAGASLDAMDALNDAADATGSTVERMSALERVAQINGQTLDDVTGIVVKFNSALKDAKAGSGVAEALQAIGLSAEDLKRIDPAEALRQTAVALQGFADDGSKARLVQELFGKSVRDAAPFLKDLADAGALQATVTAEQARQAEQLNKQIGAMRAEFQGAARAVTAELVPGLMLFINRAKGVQAVEEDVTSLGRGVAIVGGLVAAMGVSVSGAVDLIGRAAGATAAQIAAIAQLDFGRVKSIHDEMAADNAAAGKRVDELVSRYLGLSTATKRATEDTSALQRLTASWTLPSVPALDGGGGGSEAQASKARARITRPVKEAVRDVHDYAAEIRREIAGMLDDTDVVRMGKLNAQLAELGRLASAGLDPQLVSQVRARLGDVGPQIDAELLRERADAAQRLNDLLGATPTGQLERTRAEIQFVTDALTEGAITAEQYNEIVSTQLGIELPAAIDEAAKAADEFAERMRSNVQDALGESVLATLRGNADDVLEIWGDMLVRMAAEALAADLGRSLFGTGGKGGLVDGASAWFSSLFAANGHAFDAAGVIPFARGGVFNEPTGFGFGRGQLGVLGEAGPEAVMPLRRGADGRLGVVAAGGGGVNIHATYNIGSGVNRAELVQAIEAGNTRLKADLARQQRYGGGLS